MRHRRGSSLLLLGIVGGILTAAPAAASGGTVRGDLADTPGAVYSTVTLPGALTSGIEDVEAGDGFVAVLKKGRVTTWDLPGFVPHRTSYWLGSVDDLTHAKQLDSGPEHLVALQDGRVYVSARSYADSNYSVPTTAQSGVISVRAGGSHTLALRGNTGRVVAWGSNSCGQAQVPEAARSGVDTIRAGGSHSLALKDGTVIAWGCIDNVPSVVRTGVTTISAGNDFNLALKNGRVYAWDDDGLIGVPTSLRSGVTRISAGYEHSLAWKNGQIISFGDDAAGETKVPSGARSATKASAGVQVTAAVSSTGGLLIWGRGVFLQGSIPASVASGVTMAACGNGFAAALKGGRVILWGDTSAGLTPVPNPARAGVDAIAASTDAVMTLEDGAVSGFGFGWTAGPPETTSGVAAIAAGTNHYLALKNGGVVAWGGNEVGQTDVPDEAKTGIVAITAGPQSSAAITSTGKLILWGIGSEVVPAGLSTGVKEVATYGSSVLAVVGDRGVIFDRYTGATLTKPRDLSSDVTAVAATGNWPTPFLAVKDGKLFRVGNAGSITRISLPAGSTIEALTGGFGHGLVIVS